MKKLRQEYKKIKDDLNMTGRGRTMWKFYNKLNDILGNRPATHPPVVLGTTDDSVLTIGEENDETLEENDAAESDKSVGNVEGENTGDVEDPDPEPHSRSTTPMPSSSTGIKGKKRKRAKGEVIEDLVNKVKTVLEGLKESNNMFLDLEEKRMKFEEQQRREERQFQLQMMLMLLGAGQPPSHPPSHPTDAHVQYFQCSHHIAINHHSTAQGLQKETMHSIQNKMDERMAAVRVPNLIIVIQVN